MSSSLLRALLSLLLVVAAGRVHRQLEAARMVRGETTLEKLERALRLDPQGYRYHFGLGIAYRDLPEIADLARARIHLEKAVELNPYSWRYRRELAQLYELSGRTAAAERAYLEAIARNPRSGSYRWRLASFYARNDSISKAMPHLKAALAADRRLYGAAFDLLLKAAGDGDHVTQVWPEDRPARLALLHLLCGRDEPPDGAFGLDFLKRIWNPLLEAPRPLSVVEGDVCIRYLVGTRRFEEARQQWIALTRANGLRDADFESRSNHVWNGGFDLVATGAELAWRLPGAAGCSVAVAAGEGLDSAALRIDFDGTANLGLAGVEQRLIVDPGRTYQLSYHARSQEISSDQGFRFEVLGAVSHQLLLATEPILGSRPWSRVTGTFETGAEHSVLLRLVRTPSLRLDNLVRGTLWIDSVGVGVSSP